MDLFGSSKLTKKYCQNRNMQVFREMKVQDGKIVAYKQFSSTLRQGEKIPAP